MVLNKWTKKGTVFYVLLGKGRKLTIYVLCSLKRGVLLLYQIDFYFVFSLYALKRFFRVFICYWKFLRWLTSSEVSQFNQFKCFINATTPELEIIK